MAEDLGPLPAEGAPLDEWREKGGRPRLCATPEEMERLIDGYRRLCVDEKRPMTMSGMALHLGFASRQSMYDYRKVAGFSYVVRQAMLMIEEQAEGRLYENQNNAGPIFILKNMRWYDKIAVEESGPDGGPIQHQHIGDEPRGKIARRIAGLAARAGTNGSHHGANGNGGSGS